MDFDFSLAMAALGVVGSGGVAWGVTNARAVGRDAKIAKIDKVLEDHVASDYSVQINTIDRLARIETKLDALHADIRGE